MKDFISGVPVDEMCSVVKKCLEKAALNNYTKLSEAAKVEGILDFCASLLTVVEHSSTAFLVFVQHNLD